MKNNYERRLILARRAVRRPGIRRCREMAVPI